MCSQDVRIKKNLQLLAYNHLIPYTFYLIPIGIMYNLSKKFRDSAV